jgi:CRP-like cAMP-binding protein
MTTAKVVLKGDLSFLNLGELLQLLGGSGSTGVLKLSSMHAEDAGYIYINEGNPVDAEHLSMTGIDVLNSFFGWLDATFEFSEEEILRHKTIAKNRMEIILDGLRLLDDEVIPRLGKASGKPSRIDVKDETGIPIIKGPLVDYLYIVDEEEFSPGQEIVVQEKFGNWLWVILEGTVEVVRLLPEGSVPINKLTEGAFIGSISALNEKSNVRSASVKAVTRLQLGVLDYHRILEEFTKISDQFKEVLFSIENRLKQITKTCAGAHFKKIKAIQNMGDLKRYMFKAEDENFIYKITSGKAVVVKPVNKHFLQLAMLTPGDFIGNIPFLSTAHEPESAHVYVSEDCETERIDLIDLKEEYDELSATMKNMILHTSICLSVTSGRLMEILKNSRRT